MTTSQYWNPAALDTRQVSARDIAALTANICESYPALTLARAAAAGARWYPEAHELACDIAAGSDRTLEQSAGVISSYSQRVFWKLTVERACTFALTGSAPGLTAPTARARAIWALTEPRAADLGHICEMLRGQRPGADKLASFADNIARPWQSDAVTLDIHMFTLYGAAAAHSSPGTAVNYSTGQRQSLYAVIAAGLAEFARVYFGAAQPCEVQAMLWVLWRGRAK